jgi:hypothetical protein
MATEYPNASPIQLYLTSAHIVRALAGHLQRERAIDGAAISAKAE